jgi:hypothetical protein
MFERDRGDGRPMTLDRKKALALIKRNIEESGFHIYIVSAGSSPRFAYTIGLRESLGAELVLAGGFFFEKSDQVLEILHSVRKQLASGMKGKLGPVWQSELVVPELGKFTLRQAHASWTRSLLLGALDYYSIEDVDAYQIVPEARHRTIDVPNTSKEWSATDEPMWRWRDDGWPYTISPRRRGHDEPRRTSWAADHGGGSLRGGILGDVCGGEWPRGPGR